MNKKEQWRDVVGYEGLYQVSNLGRVRSIDRVVPHKRFGTQKRRGRVLSPASINRCGHVAVVLQREGKSKCRTVHRLVAEAFLGPCPDGCMVLHGANGMSDNSASNLSYGTNSQNQLDRRRDGNSCGRSVIRSDGIEFDSLTEAAEESNCNASTIGNVCSGRRKTAGGFGWRYLD